MSSSAPRISAQRQRWQPSSWALDQGCTPERLPHRARGTSPHCFLQVSLLLPQFLIRRCWSPVTEQSCRQPSIDPSHQGTLWRWLPSSPGLLIGPESRLNFLYTSPHSLPNPKLCNLVWYTHVLMVKQENLTGCQPSIPSLWFHCSNTSQKKILNFLAFSSNFSVMQLLLFPSLNNNKQGKWLPARMHQLE